MSTLRDAQIERSLEETGSTERALRLPDGVPQALVRLAETEPLLAAERIMAHLRSAAGCPWDREQTFDSIRRHTLEEVYEVFDAIERRDWPALQDELGDLFLQVLFYAQMAAEEERFALADVARSLNAKLIRRHPHIFAGTAVADSSEVKRNWEAIKREEMRSKPGASLDAPASLLAEVPRHLPALSEARKLGSAAARVNFDWSEISGVFAKAHEELRELEAEVTGTPAGVQPVPRPEIEEEFGDVLFTMSSLARHLGVDAEMALRAANAKFRRRFSAMESIAAGRGETLRSRGPDDLEALWSEAKQASRKGDGA